jgi:hypothetical protein
MAAIPAGKSRRCPPRAAAVLAAAVSAPTGSPSADSLHSVFRLTSAGVHSSYIEPRDRRSGYFSLYVIVRRDSWRLTARLARAQLPGMPGLRAEPCALSLVSAPIRALTRNEPGDRQDGYPRCPVCDCRGGGKSPRCPAGSPRGNPVLWWMAHRPHKSVVNGPSTTLGNVTNGPSTTLLLPLPLRAPRQRPVTAPFRADPAPTKRGNSLNGALLQVMAPSAIAVKMFKWGS